MMQELSIVQRRDRIHLSFDPPAIPGIATTGGFEFEVEDLNGKGALALDAATQALLATKAGGLACWPSQCSTSRSVGWIAMA